MLGVGGLRGLAENEVHVLQRRFGILRALGDTDRGVDDIRALLRHGPAERRAAINGRLSAVAGPARHGHLALREELSKLGVLRVESQNAGLQLLDQLETRVGILGAAAAHVGRGQQEKRSMGGRNIGHDDFTLIGRVPHRHPGIGLRLDLVLFPNECLGHVHELCVGVALHPELRIELFDVGHLGSNERLIEPLRISLGGTDFVHHDDVDLHVILLGAHHGDRLLRQSRRNLHLDVGIGLLERLDDRLLPARLERATVDDDRQFRLRHCPRCEQSGGHARCQHAYRTLHCHCIIPFLPLPSLTQAGRRRLSSGRQDNASVSPSAHCSTPVRSC